MSRRGAAAGTNRRSGGGGGGGGSGSGRAPTIPQLLAALGSDARGWWTVYDPSLPADPGLALTNPGSGDEVTSWTDQINGFVLSALGAGQRPSYAADGANFGGRSLVQTATASTRILQGDFGSTWIATGERLMVLTAARLRTAVNNVFAWEFSEGANDRGTYLLTGNTATAFQTGPGNTQFLSLNNELDTSQHIFLTNVDPVTGSRLEMQPENVAATAVSTSGMSGNLDRVTFGARRTPSGPGDWSLAEVIVGRNVPAATVAALMSLMRAKWGI